MAYQPGQTGNPGGRPKSAKLFRDALLAALKRADDDGERLQRVADKLVAEGLAGNVVAIKEIADRVDGKVPQAIVGDDAEPPVRMALIQLKAVYPKDDTGSAGG